MYRFFIIFWQGGISKTFWCSKRCLSAIFIIQFIFIIYYLYLLFRLYLLFIYQFSTKFIYIENFNKDSFVLHIGICFNRDQFAFVFIFNFKNIFYIFPRVMNTILRVQICELRVKIHEFKFTSCEFNFKSYEFKSMSCELRSTSLRMNVNSLKISSFPKILSLNQFGNS